MIGGVFTSVINGINIGWRRDKDMPSLLLRSDNSIGFFGSDTYGEINDEYARRLEFIPLIHTKIRFTLAAPAKRAAKVYQKINSGEELTIATSYEQKTRQAAEMLGFSLKEIVVLNGSVEAAPDDDPTIDAVIDIVDSGETMRRSGLKILESNLGEIAVGASWAR